MERAYSDGCDIINLSISGGASWFDTSDSLVATRLEEAGVIVVAAAGNDRDLGAFRMS
jgi:subtilisin family serine protease